MESQPQNPEFRINPENFHPCIIINFSLGLINFKEPSTLKRDMLDSVGLHE